MDGKDAPEVREQEIAPALQEPVLPEPPLPVAPLEHAAPRQPRFNFKLATVPGWLYVWIPIVTSLASLGIAIWSLLLTTSEPEVKLIMPEWVRIGQGGTNLTRVILQPSFVSTGSSRVDVILTMKLDVTELSSGEKRELGWLERGQWDTSSLKGAGPVYRYVSDPGPLLVNPDNPQLPIALFTTDPNWRFKAGKYRLTITAQRAVSPIPLEESIVITLTPELIKYYDENQGQFWIPIHIDS